MESKTRSEILLVGTDSDLESRLRTELRSEAYSVTSVTGGDESFGKAIQSRIDVVVSGIGAPGLSGLSFLSRIHPLKPKLPIILIDGVSKESASAAIRLGAFQVLSKPFDFCELLECIRKAALSTRDSLPALEAGEAECGQTGLIGTSRLIRDVYQQVCIAANSHIPVLLLGATGTGKELIARAIHRQSSRARHELVALNCSAIPQSLLESELFGHEGGAFTGARHRRAGRFEQAHRGTLFLDEIGDLSPDIQVKLLRFLEDNRLEAAAVGVTTDSCMAW